MADAMEETTKQHEAPKHLPLMLSLFAVFVLIGAGVLAWVFIERTGTKATPPPILAEGNAIGG